MTSKTRHDSSLFFDAKILSSIFSCLGLLGSSLCDRLRELKKEKRHGIYGVETQI